jgi:lipid A 4'-phosphatase
MRYIMHKALKESAHSFPNGWMALSLALGMLVYWFPGVDMWVSAWFVCEGHFYLNQHPLATTIHDAVRWIVIGMVLGYIGLMVGNVWRKHSIIPTLTTRMLCYLLVILALGPGLVVNTLFKEHWGRARPLQIEAFGGSKQFTPAFVLSDQCQSNCSFVSGDASVGFYLFGFVMLYGRRWLWLPLTAGGILGAVRIIQGAHFFSDVLFSAIFTFWVCYFVYDIFFPKKRTVFVLS